MPTQIKGLEKEYILREAAAAKVSTLLTLSSSAWTVQLLEIRGSILFFSHTIPLNLIPKGSKADLSYEAKGNTITFKTVIAEPGNRIVGLSVPDILYKDLSRKFMRLSPPADLAVSFSLAGERYDLDFPSVSGTGFDGALEPSGDFDAKNLRGLMEEFARKADAIADEKRIAMFTVRKPDTPSERLCASTGKALYIPNTMSGIPLTDPFADKTILTREDALSWFASTGTDLEHAEESVKQLERATRNSGKRSELIVPVVFQNYAIGLICLAVKEQATPYLDLSAVETFVSFSRVLSHALYIHGYFKDSPKIATDFKATIVDVSAGGLLFSCVDAKLLANMREGSEVSVVLRGKKRTVNAGGKIKRHYAAKTEGYFGIEFTVMAPEDFRFLFEYLYGKPFTDQDASSYEGSRLSHP